MIHSACKPGPMATDGMKESGLAQTSALPVIIMDFTGVYHYEPFAQSQRFIWLDCRHLSGTCGYCDAAGSEAIRQVMADYPAEGIHFIDSGNYHYLSKFWTDKIDRPFTLIVFDHHPDMQPPLFDGLLSCGSWVKGVLDDNPLCRKVVVAGASDKLIQSVPHCYGHRVRFYGETALEQANGWHRFSREHIEDPVYISIDKDILNPQSALTDWDQGPFSLQELEKLLAVVLSHEQVIGVDICGECAATLHYMEEQREALIDGQANAELLHLIVSYGDQNAFPRCSSKGCPPSHPDTAL